MEKIHIDGINGYFEANKKYVIVVLGRKDKTLLQEHIVFYDEIEDIIYKKPTREKFGFITLYLLTKSYVTNNKIKYSLLLDKIDEKSLESNKKIFDFIKNIIKNKKVEVQEVIETKEEDKKEEDKKEKKKNEDIKSPSIITEPPIIETVITISEDTKEEIIEKPKEIKVIIEKIPEIEDEKIEEETLTNEEIISPVEEEKVIEEVNNDLSNGYKLEEIKTETFLDEEQDDVELEEEIIEEQEEKKENTHFSTIEKLEKKIEDLEKQIKKLAYKEIIINNYIDETKERKKIEKYILELNKIIEQLEKIKKEISKQEKTLSENDIIKVENGTVIITGIGRLSIDDKKEKVEEYLDTYKSVIKELDIIEKDVDKTSKEADSKRDNLKISEDEYEKSINAFRNVKSNKEMIKDYIKESKEDLKKVKMKIEKTVNPRVKYKYVRRSISDQTKLLAGMTTLNMLRPKRSRLSSVALSLFTGVSTIGDLLSFDIKKIEYNEVIIKEMLVGLESVDTSKARFMIDSSKDQIDKILYDCEKKYLDYPKYKELKKDLLSIKNDIEKEDLELKAIEEQITNYKLNSKVKILKYNE